MVETELKLLVPEGARRMVERELAAGGRSTVQRLRAHYFDTADRRLAAAGLALRLRREGRRWVQTLKGAGDGLQRSEHEVPLGSGAARPALDIARHAGTAAGDALAALLADGAPLIERFRTDVRRRVRAARTRAGSVELAFDSGEIVAGTARAPICELEIELKRGAAQTVLDAAWRWVERHALVLDPRTKAERGDALARGEPVPPPRKAAAPSLDHVAPDEASLFAACVASTLDQALANAAPIAGGDATPEHVHQLRVALRRLRTAFKLFEPLVPHGLDERVAALFGRLGAARDRDALAESVLPLLRAAGAPLADLPHDGDGAASPAHVLCEPDASLLWLELIALARPPANVALIGDGDGGEPAPSAAASFGAKIERLHRRVARDARRFDTLDADARHTLRKRAKRLRYAIEFGGSLYRKKAVERYLKRLRPVQEALGALNDLQIATAAFERIVADDARAWFALGWLAARHDAALGECAATLRELRRTKRFW